MKATKSRDGRFRYTIRSEHRIGMDELTSVVMSILNFQYMTTDRKSAVIDGINNLTKKEVMEATRSLLEDHGSEFYWGPQDEFVNRLKQWRLEYDDVITMIEARLAELFPDLHPNGGRSS